MVRPPGFLSNGSLDGRGPPPVGILGVAVDIKR